MIDNIHEKIADVDWQTVTGEMNKKGYASVSRFLLGQACDELTSKYNSSDLHSKTITMERHRFGLGEYKYFKYPLPDLIQNIRTAIYPKLAPIANAWMKMLNVERHFPDTFDDLQRLCHDNSQIEPTVLILKYGMRGYNTLHQDLYGEIFFPFQLVFFLNEPEVDYTGGVCINRASSKSTIKSNCPKTT